MAAVAGKELALKGREGVAACTSCHGENGEGNFELGYPRLAGLHPKYITKQLYDFARDPLDIGVKVDPIPRDYEKTPGIYKDLTVFTPGIRFDAMMNPIARALSDEEIDQLANYYGSLPFTTKHRVATAQGESLANKIRGDTPEHHHDQARIPVTHKVKEVNDLVGLCHAGYTQADSKNQSTEKDNDFGNH